jgi:hypothetical protein
MVSFRHWKLRCYRKTWCAVQQFWTAPRWIRVTDDADLEQFVQVNGWEKDPNTGFPVVINKLAALDVDIIIEEGPDGVNVMADTFELITGLAKGGAQIPPEMIIELSPLPTKVKQQIQAQMKQATEGPMQQNAIQLKLQEVMAKIEEIKSQTALNYAKAAEAGQPEAGGPAAQVDTPADLAKADLDTAKATEIRHKIEVGAHVPQAKEPPPPPPEVPGLFDLNMAKAGEAHARAETARSQAGLHEAARLKTMLEARTIDEAPEGQLVRPPPRPPASRPAGT